MERLIDILSMRREHDSDGELNFIGKYLTPMQPKMLFNDEGDVLAYVIDNSKGKSSIMWSCHIDTMHRNRTKEPERLTQEVWVDHEGTAFVDSTEDCLGADDGAGIWLLLEMIDADVAGTYVFHRGEEKGCWGSSRIAVQHQVWLANFTHAIAFDRKGTSSVITHQTGARACSELLGEKLAQLFNMKYELDPTGVYTDTAEYMEIIPECVNVSCGYYSEHSSRETLDTNHIIALRDAVCAVDWLTAELPVDRDPTVYEGRQYGYGTYGSFGTHESWEDKDWGNKTKSLPMYPDIDELANATMPMLQAWVRKSDSSDIAALIQDIAQQYESLQYDIEFYLDRSPDVADDGDDVDYLDVGLR